MTPVLSVESVQPIATISPSFAGVFADHWDEGTWDDGRTWDEMQTVATPTMNVTPDTGPSLSV